MSRALISALLFGASDELRLFQQSFGFSDQFPTDPDGIADCFLQLPNFPVGNLPVASPSLCHEIILSVRSTGTP